MLRGPLRGHLSMRVFLERFYRNHFAIAARHFRFITNFQAQQCTGDGNGVSDQTLFQIGFILADNRECLRTAIVAFDGNACGEGYFLGGLGGLDQLRGGAALRLHPLCECRTRLWRCGPPSARPDLPLSRR